MIFSIAGDDDDALEVPFSPSDYKQMPLLDELKDEAPIGEASLSTEEQKEYDEIEAQFQKFKSRQSEVERNVADLLARLNTRINVPSSVASSECGDLTSLASSEWDTESLGPTEDGLSMLGSRVGSRSGTPRGGSPHESPRELTPLQRAATSSSDGLKTQLQQAGIEWKAPPKVAYSSPFSSPGPPAYSAASSSQAGGFQPFDRRASEGGLVLGMRGSDASDVRGVPPALPLDLGAGPPAGDRPHADRLSGEPLPEARSPRLTQRLLQERASALPPPSPAWSGQGEEAPSAGAAPSSQPAPLGADTVYPSPKWARNQPPSPQGPRLPQFGAPGVCDGSEADPAEDEEEIRRWQGWTVVATLEGRLFFHHETRLISQWHQPPELNEILGEWVEMMDDSQPSQPSYWRNELLNIALWKDPRMTTNLFQAALDGNIFFMQLYAEVDGMLDVTDARGRSALHYSCAGGSTQSAVFLLQRGAEVDRRDDAEATPLIFACRYGYASVVKVLLDASADLNAASEGGNTALHEAASMGQLDCVHLLLLCGADPTRLNDAREAPEDIATAKRHLSCLTLLHRHTGASQRHRPMPDGPPLGMPGYGAAGGPGLEVSRGAAGSTSPGPLRAEAATAEAKAAPPAAMSHLHHRGARQRKPGRTARAQYGRGESSESDGGMNGASALDQDGTDSGGASSESSDGAARASTGRPHRGRGRRRERSPVALGLLSRMQSAIGAASRWAFKGPIQADLGLPNKYYYNEETKRWELNGDEDAGPR